jgi:hypothetical protein
VSKLVRDCVSHDFQIIPAKRLQLTGGRIFGHRFKRDRNNLVHGIRSEHEATLELFPRFHRFIPYRRRHTEAISGLRKNHLKVKEGRFRQDIGWQSI